MQLVKKKSLFRSSELMESDTDIGGKTNSPNEPGDNEMTKAGKKEKKKDENCVIS
jgi:hypothetical protein